MVDEHQSNADLLLSAIKRQEKSQGRGTLKVFLGMAPGVGKTYAMLEAARRELNNGRDVMIGYVETHGRRETDALAASIPAIPRRSVEYRGVTLSELDLDAILARHPNLVLIDELAHTNAPGARHPKRYQDVLEILNAGINVFTTLNVQHVESRAEIVRQVTGATIQETVPDSALDDAIIELVDLPPGELMRRLAEGKVYIADRAATASKNFFREGNLTALRELALRLAAEHVAQDVRDYLQSRQIPGPWKSGQRLLVAISPSPLSESMARWTRRLADNLQAPWMAVYVDTGRPLCDEEQTRLQRNLTLARELGAEVITTSDQDIVSAILRVARQHNVTQIVVGKPVGIRSFGLLGGTSMLSRLIRESGNIDVQCVRANGEEAAYHPPQVGWSSILWRQYATAVGTVGAITFINFLLRQWTGHYAVSLLYLAVVVGLALFVGRGPIMLAATLSALLWNFFFLPPTYTFYIKNFQDALMFAMFFVVAAAMGQLTARIRAQQFSEREREERSTALYLLTRELAEAKDMSQLLVVIVQHVGKAFHAEIALLLADDQGKLAPYPFGALELSEKEAGVADWVYRNRKQAGAGTDTLTLAEATYLPLLTVSGCVGVIGIKPNPKRALSLQEQNLLETFARQIALVLDRQRLSDTEHNAKLLAESERLGRALLNSISHELRTPIAAITAANENLGKPSFDNDASSRRMLREEIGEATQRLNRLVGNLLDITRLESGHIKPKLDWCDIVDLINIAVKGTATALAKHEVVVSIPERIPLLNIDFSLVEQALKNILVNAATYTPPGTRVEIAAWTKGNCVEIEIADNGPGIPEDALHRVFEKFYRGPGMPVGGTGLGLSIVKGFIEAQGGNVAAANRPTGGAVFTIRFPIRTVPPMPPE